MTKATFERFSNNTNPKWWKDACLRMNVFYCIGCMMCPVYLGYDQSLLVGLQALPRWKEYFHSPSGPMLGLITSSIMLPAIVFGFPASWICMRWGHRWAIMTGCILTIVGAIWNALSLSRTHFIVSRLIAGAGGTISKVGAPALLHETAHPRLRSPLGYMYFACYYIGSILSSIMSTIGLYIEAPESPRFMVSKGHNQKALAMLARHHANGDENDALVKWELQEIESSLEDEAQNHKSSYLDFLRTKGNRKRLAVAAAFAIGANWLGNGIVSYYFTPVLTSVGVKKPIQILSVNLGLNIWNLILAQYAGFNIDRFGRRPLLFAATVGMIFSYSFVMGFSAGFAETGSKALGICAIPFLFFFFGFYDVAWTPLNYSYATEIMPYHLRTKGLAIYNTIQQLGNSFNQFVNPIALQAITWKYYGVYIAVECLYVVLIYFFFPETKKLSIEEVALVFDYGMKDGRVKAAANFRDEFVDGGDVLKQVPKVEHKEFLEKHECNGGTIRENRI
ncbi:hexose transporter protein [Talaromyces stipitatus ATCC 10500]|uniref:Hexose transporter protein n=1 Tax=Talaromyces stipitatus (strain ATCC 10500 / CBS 375.48 / QM 6759 / NRRL 1006) TaxID=441959 RepID=B8MME6_TALSN|nr:hexose transporter protein [Talaromyces stipitatus ATCC 10500]EED13700.1 hexose transporter protein [Talaromyces stipitatus ATCC 10500]